MSKTEELIERADALANMAASATEHFVDGERLTSVTFSGQDLERFAQAIHAYVETREEHRKESQASNVASTCEDRVSIVKKELIEEFAKSDFSIQIDTKTDDRDDLTDLEAIRQLEKEGVCESHMHGSILCAHAKKRASAPPDRWAALHGVAMTVGLNLLATLMALLGAGVVVFLIWNWFVTTHLHALPLPLAGAIAIVLLVRVAQRPPVDAPQISFKKLLFTHVGQAIFALLLIYLLHLASSVR